VHRPFYRTTCFILFIISLFISFSWSLACALDLLRALCLHLVAQLYAPSGGPGRWDEKLGWGVGLAITRINDTSYIDTSTAEKMGCMTWHETFGMRHWNYLICFFVWELWESFV
jgi:hypothetical protein